MRSHTLEVVHSLQSLFKSLSISVLVSRPRLQGGEISSHCTHPTPPHTYTPHTTPYTHTAHHPHPCHIHIAPYLYTLTGYARISIPAPQGHALMCPSSDPSRIDGYHSHITTHHPLTMILSTLNALLVPQKCSFAVAWLPPDKDDIM